MTTWVTLKLGSVFSVAGSRRGLQAGCAAGETSVGVPASLPDIAMGGDPSGDADLAWWRFTLPPLKANCRDGGVPASDSWTYAAVALPDGRGDLLACSRDLDRARDCGGGVFHSGGDRPLLYHLLAA